MDTAKPSFDFRPYQPGDEKAIFDLFELSYSRPLDPAVWRWRFVDNPSGPGVIWLAWDGDTLAAHYAVSSIRLSIEGIQVNTGLSGTTMTGPRYRGLGLFPELARLTYREMQEKGQKLVWGFPNANSHRGFIRTLGWTDVCEVPTFKVRTAHAKGLPSSGTEEIAFCDEDFDALWQEAKGTHPVSVWRDARHLAWRYIENPSQQYRILAHREAGQLLGYAVFKRYEDEIQIVDFLAVSDEKVAISLVSGVLEVATNESAQAVSLWLNLCHPLHLALERAGFHPGSPVTYFGARTLAAGDDLSAVWNFKNWHLVMGDSDVY